MFVHTNLLGHGTSRAIVGPRLSCVPALLTSQRILKILFQSKNSWIYFKIAMCGFPFSEWHWCGAISWPPWQDLGLVLKLTADKDPEAKTTMAFSDLATCLPRNEQFEQKKIVVLEDELPFEKAQACRCHVSFRGYGTSFGGRNYHSNRFKWMISFHVSRPTWWPCNKRVVEYTLLA